MSFHIRNINILMIFMLFCCQSLQIFLLFFQKEIFSKPNALSYFPIVMVIQFKALSKAEQYMLFLFQLLKILHWWRLLHLKTLFFTEKKLKGFTFCLNLNLSSTILVFFLVFKTSQSLPFSSVKYLKPGGHENCHILCVYMFQGRLQTFHCKLRFKRENIRWKNESVSVNKWMGSKLCSHLVCTRRTMTNRPFSYPSFML